MSNIFNKSVSFLKGTLFLFKKEREIMNQKIDLLIVGLGNPGSKYENNRHNIGWIIIDEFVEKHKINWEHNTNIYYGAIKKYAGKNVFICKPTTYMNNSGEAVRKICDKYNINKKNVLIITDEYNFDVGKFQVKRSGSSGGHNGMASVIMELGISDFMKMRCGIGKNFPPGGMVNYVLSDFSQEEAVELKNMKKQACEAIEEIIKNGDKVTSHINSGELWNKNKPVKEPKDHGIKRATVYAASSKNVDQIYLKDASKLGKLLSANNIEIIYGGGKVGLMGSLANAAIENEGVVKGIIPDFMMDLEWGHDKIKELKIVGSMHERKAELILETDVVIALPGGSGTLEELFEVITLKRLGLFTKPIIIINSNGFYNDLKKMLEKIVAEKFMNPEHLNMWTFIDRPEELITAIKKAEKWSKDAIKFAQA
jgi:aminoacyl-tRNA hydrolase